MFHFRFHSGVREPSGTQAALHGRLPRFMWVVVTIFSLLLVFGVASLPALAATGTPTLKVVPKFVDPDHTNSYCHGGSPSVSYCYVRLTETLSSSKPLHWSTRTDVSLTVHPSSGNLSPGQSVNVKITVDRSTCLGGPNVYFIGPKNVATVEVFCD